MTPTLPPPSDHVHRYRVGASWTGSTGAGYGAYDRGHRAATEPPTVDLALSADPAFLGDPARPNPEQLLVAAAVSCQLLSFLAVAARARLDVLAYRDRAEAEMPEADPPVRITRIALRPHVTVAAEGDRETVTARVRRLAEVAHRECYIANTVRAEITIETTVTIVAPPPT